MNHNRRTEILSPYIPIYDIFTIFSQEKDAVFLDSSLENKLGRYSIIGLNPYLKLVNGREFTVNGQVSAQSFESYLKEYLKNHRDENHTDLPIVSGAIGYFSYEYGRKKEKIQHRAPGQSCNHHQHTQDPIPDCILNFYDIFIIEDHVKKQVTITANGKLENSSLVLEKLKEKIYSSPSPSTPSKLGKQIKIESDFNKEDYLNAVQTMMNYMVAGDIYIANMTRKLNITSSREPYEVFQRLRIHNPSPFGGYLNLGDFQIVCASPERFLKMQNGHVETRPIKGTRKRGKTKEEDDLLRAELLESEKDKSELLMIVDLERNDLNRVCKPGSVKVTELFTIEEYATVFHLSANIQGELKEGRTVMDLIEAAFPGGSITGAPKKRAMEIIEELEHEARELYTGSIGYLTLDGGCDFNIVIRTAVYQNGCWQLGVGGGITCESDTEFEYEETTQKAAAMINALS